MIDLLEFSCAIHRDEHLAKLSKFLKIEVISLQKLKGRYYAVYKSKGLA